MNLAEVFANPITLAEEIQKFKDHNWTSAEWDLFCESLKPFKEQLRAVHDEAYEAGETAGFDDGAHEGYEQAEKDFKEDMLNAEEKSYDEGYKDAERDAGTEKEKSYESYDAGYKKGYEAAKKEFSHPINTPNSLKG